MSTDGKGRVVIKWLGRYLSAISKAGEPTFTWAPVSAKTFESEAAARAFVTAHAMKFPGDYEVVDDPVRQR